MSEEELALLTTRTGNEVLQEKSCLCPSSTW